MAKTKRSAEQLEQRADVVKQITPCPTCGCSLEPINKRLVREGAASGERDGRQYHYYRMSKANCRNPACNRLLMLWEYDFLPDKALQNSPGVHE